MNFFIEAKKQNMNMKYIPLKLEKFEECEWSVIARCVIPKFTYICEYSGNVKKCISFVLSFFKVFFADMNGFSAATDEITLLKSSDSSNSLIIAPLSHSNLGRFFNSPCKKQKENMSVLPNRANMESIKICIEEQVRIVLRTNRIIKEGEHLVWEYAYQ